MPSKLNDETAPPDPDLAKVAKSIAKAVIKRRALPTGYAVFFVIARAPDDATGREGSMTVASIPAQAPDVVEAFLRQAAEQITPVMTTHAVVRPKPALPTGNA